MCIRSKISSDDIDPITAEKWDFYSRVFSANETCPYVKNLAFRIASFKKSALTNAKSLVNRTNPVKQKYLQLEAIGFVKDLFAPSTGGIFSNFVELGYQTEEGANRLGEIVGKMSD